MGAMLLRMSVLLTVAVWLPAPILGQDRNSAAPAASRGTSASKSTYVPAGEIQGKLVRLDSDKHTLVVQLTYSYVKGRKLETDHKEIELQTADDFQVRLISPPPAYDDKGNPKKYTPSELRSLRGRGNLPGYRGDWDNLHPDQVLRLILAVPKGRSSGSGHSKMDAEPIAQNQPLVRTVIVLQDSSH